VREFKVRHDEIVEEITRLSEATADLKKQLDKPKSKLDSFKEYAGVVSLLLSLATGFFAIYTSFFAEPAKSRAEAQGKLHDVLAQIVTLDQEYMHELQQMIPLRIMAHLNQDAIFCYSRLRTSLIAAGLPLPRTR
jgi:hypothetical protein